MNQTGITHICMYHRKLYYSFWDQRCCDFATSRLDSQIHFFVRVGFQFQIVDFQNVRIARFVAIRHSRIGGGGCFERVEMESEKGMPG